MGKKAKAFARIVDRSPTAEPIVCAIVSKKGRRAAIEISGPKREHHVVDQIVDIEKHRIKRRSHAIGRFAHHFEVIFVCRICVMGTTQVPQILPGSEIAIGHPRDVA